MRRHAPAYYDEGGEIWGITRYADVRAIGQDPQTFSSAQGSRPNTPLPYMIDMDAPEHRRRRRLVSAGFTPEAVRHPSTACPSGLRRDPGRRLREGRAAIW